MPPIFDPETFVNQTYTDAGSTDYPVIPEGEYRAMTGDGPVSKWFGTGRNRDGEEFRTFEAPIIILDDNVKVEMGLDPSRQLRTRYRGFVDIDSATGGLDMHEGKNIKINQLREVLDQNVAGRNWSPNDLANKGPFLARVRHTFGKDGQPYADVSRVTKL